MSHVSVIRRHLHYYAQPKMQHLSLEQAMQRIRGFIDLVFDLTEEITHLVEENHDKMVQRTLRRDLPAGLSTSHKLPSTASGATTWLSATTTSPWI